MSCSNIDNCSPNGKLKMTRVGGTLLKEMRYAQKSGEKLRVVIWLKQYGGSKKFFIAPSNGKDHRLVLDLSSSTLAAKQLNPFRL